MAELKDILYDMVKAIVDHPEEVSIDVQESGNDVNLILSVAPSDMGKVIGRRGRLARSLRLIMKSAANLCGKRVNVEIKE
ncbi:MAG: KH domain-containing protein [Clostridia bacterium]|nr:KH domain-containing protein [Clostridia bacterium]